MLLLKLLPLLSLLCFTNSYDLNKFIKSVEHQLDYGGTCMSKYRNKVPINSQTRLFSKQLQDHFDALNRKTWNHQYFVHNSPATEPQLSDIPIIIFGGEGPTGDTFFLFEELLPELGDKSTTFTLSHRYYQPGPDVNPTDHFVPSRDSKLLSSKQALADMAYFIEHVVLGEYKFKKLPIVFGCSYPGSLTIWFREKYPHLSMAGIALSGPIHAFDNFHQYLEVGEKAVKDLFPKCYPALLAGKKTLRDTAKNNSTAFAKQINLCTDTGFTQWEDIITVGWIRISMNFAAGLGQGGDTGSAEYMCDIVEKSGAFALTANSLGTQGGGCRDPAKVLKDNTMTPKNFEEGDPDWYWQKCSEFGWFKTHSNDSLFELFPLEAFHKVCKDDYGVDDDLLRILLDETNDFYGGTNITQLTKLLILNGADDPWHAPSMYEYGSDYSGLVSKWIPHGHHCTFVDGRYTEEAKRIAKEAIDAWLK